MNKIKHEIILLHLINPFKPYEVNICLLKKIPKILLYNIYKIAKKNKLEFLLLYSLAENMQYQYPFLYNKFKIMKKLYFKHLSSIHQTSELLKQIGIDHVFIKTICGFSTLPSDIDILVKNRNERILGVKYLSKHGYQKFDEGIHFTSLYNRNLDDMPLEHREKAPYDVDLYDEISLNFFVYLDKSLFFYKRRTMGIKTSEGTFYVPIFKPEYELLIHINHVVFEQLITLLDIYRLSELLSICDPRLVVNLARKIKSITALSGVLQIYFVIINKSNLELVERKILSYLDLLKIDDKFEYFMPKLEITLPYRFPISIVTRAFIEKITSRSLLNKTIKDLHRAIVPSNIVHIYKQLILRRKRETY